MVAFESVNFLDVVELEFGLQTLQVLLALGFSVQQLVSQFLLLFLQSQYFILGL